MLEDSSWFKKAHRRAGGCAGRGYKKMGGGWYLELGKSGRRDSGGSRRMKIRY